MPANKNAILRYRLLDEILSDSHHYLDMGEIVQKVNLILEKEGFATVTRRTIEMDLNAIEYDIFHAPIKRFSYAGKRCLTYEKPSFSIFHKELSNEETQLLGEIIQTIGQFDGLPHFKWLDNLQGRLSISKQKKYIYFSANAQVKNVHLLAQLYDCTSNEQVVKIIYRKFGFSNSEELCFHPYFLKEYNNRWYIIGWDANNDKIKNLALDRIQQIIVQPELAIKPCPIDIDDYYKNSVGITVWDNVIPSNILFWVSDSESEYITTKPIHPSQKRISSPETLETLYKKYQKNNGTFFSLRCQESYELERELISHFSEIEVLEPLSLRESVKTKILQMSKIYLDKRRKIS